MVGSHVIALIDSVSFFVASLRPVVVRVDKLAGPGRAETDRGIGWFTGVTADARHMWQSILLRQIVIGTPIAILAVGSFVPVDCAAAGQGLHRSERLAVQGAGAIVGGPTAASCCAASTRGSSPGRPFPR